MAVENVSPGVGMDGGGSTPTVTLDILAPLELGNGGTGGTNSAIARHNLFSFAGQAVGDLYYRSSATALARLPVGTDGQVLTVADGIPAWGAGGGGGPGTPNALPLTGGTMVDLASGGTGITTWDSRPNEEVGPMWSSVEIGTENRGNGMHIQNQGRIGIAIENRGRWEGNPNGIFIRTFTHPTQAVGQGSGINFHHHLGVAVHCHDHFGLAFQSFQYATAGSSSVWVRNQSMHPSYATRCEPESGGPGFQAHNVNNMPGVRIYVNPASTALRAFEVRNVDTGLLLFGISRDGYIELTDAARNNLRQALGIT